MSSKTIGYFYIISLVISFVYGQNVVYEDRLIVILSNITIGAPFSFSLNSTTEYLLILRNNGTNLNISPPRIELECESCTDDYPILSVVRRQREVLSWELPLVIDASPHRILFNKTARTLCPDHVLYESKNPMIFPMVINRLKYKGLDHPISYSPEEVVLSLSTSSLTNSTGTLIVTLQEDFVIKLNEPLTITVTPSTPIYYSYRFPEEDKSVLLRVDSDDDVCMTVSIQNMSCPVFDLERSIQFEGYWQTVTRRGGITLTKAAFPHGFYVVFVVKGDDIGCTSHTVLNRTKTLTFKLNESISQQDYIVATFVAIAVVAVFYVVSISISVFYAFKVKQNVPQLDDEETEVAVASVLPSSSSFPTLSENGINTLNSPTTPMTDGTLSMNSDSSLDETDIDMMNDIESDKHIFRSKSVLCVSDLARKNPRILSKKSQMYFWNLLTVATFYFLPVVQLVITYQYVVNQTGNQDMCYYNFLCAHPVGFLSDFNHVFSNIAYIGLGLLFISLTFRRQRMHSRLVAININIDKKYGIPQHYGLFYAMGSALSMEGVLSGCYHVCPNHSNFQFDTSFMYVISTMCILKIYQTRHPDVNANAYSTFGVLAGVILLGMSGVLWGTRLFWYSFTFIHLTCCLLLSFRIYYMTKVNVDCGAAVRLWRTMVTQLRSRSCNFLVPNYPYRLLLLTLGNLCNVALAIIGPMYLGDFATYLLAIFMANLMLYYLFYIVMKLCNGEKILLQPSIYMLTSFVAWGASGYFFFHKSISWKNTPAESKLFNQPCVVLDFYDNHDIWHFLSAFAMFLSFMTLLTLDDDLMYVSRKKIAVF